MNKVINRIQWIDNAKFFGIFLVVLGHTSLPKTITDIIYAFHIPLFFFMSGLVFNKSKFSSFGSFVKHRFLQLMVPYFVFGIITYVFWFFVGRKFGNYAPVDPLTPLMGMLHGTDMNDHLIHCGSLWFLPCLFLVELIYFLVSGYANNYILLVILALVGYGNWKLKHEMLPWSFDVALIAILFYATASIFKERILLVAKLRSLFKILIIILSVVILFVFTKINGRADMSSGTYENYFLFFVTAVAGIVATSLFSMMVSENISCNKVMSFFATGTLIILVFHAIVNSIIKVLSIKILKIDAGIFQNALLSNFLLTILTFITLIPFIIIIQRYLPFTLGRFTSSK